MPFFGYAKKRKELDKNEILKVAAKVLSEMAEFGENSGGVISLFDYQAEKFLIPGSFIGQVPSKSKKKFLNSCSGKICVLRTKHPQNEHFYTWHISSRGKFEAGAIFDERYILAFCGSSMEVNEAVAIITALRCGQITFGRAISISGIFQNRIILNNKEKWGL